MKACACALRHACSTRLQASLLLRLGARRSGRKVARRPGVPRVSRREGVSHVLANVHAEEHGLLLHEGEPGAQPRRVERGHVVAVDGDHAATRLVEAHEEREDLRALAQCVRGACAARVRCMCIEARVAVHVHFACTRTRLRMC